MKKLKRYNSNNKISDKVKKTLFLSLLISLVLTITFNMINYIKYKNKESDYKFVFDAKEGGSKDIFFVHEAGKFMTANEYNKVYKKKHNKSLKLNNPITPKEPEKIISTLKSSVINEFKEVSNGKGWRSITIKIYESFINLTNYEELKINNLNIFNYLYEQTGIKTNEKYFEELIKNSLNYIDDKMLAQIDNKNNPYKDNIEAIRGNSLPDKDTEWRTIIGHWLLYGGKVSPDKFNFDRYNYTTPYFGLLSYRITYQRNKEINVLGIFPSYKTVIEHDIDKLSMFNIYEESEYEKLSYKYYKINEIKDIALKSINSEKDKIKESLNFDNYGDSLNNIIGEDVFNIICIIDGGLYEASVCYYKEEFILYDIILKDLLSYMVIKEN